MIIDTNVYSNAAKNIQSAVEIFKTNKIIYFPVFAVAELEFGFRNGVQTTKNRDKLYKFLNESGMSVLTPTLETVVEYAELAYHAKKSGRVLSNNDVWIAALALENNIPLATFDKDFAAFADILGDKLLILN